MLRLARLLVAALTAGDLGGRVLAEHFTCTSNQVVASIPSFVTEYAPLVHLDVNERYLPGDIGSQLSPNTSPELNFTDVAPNATVFSLLDLSPLNVLHGASCDIDNVDSDCWVYLTSRQNISTNPAWLYGVLPNPSTGETEGVVSSAVIVNDHLDGIVDSYYMYFYPFNLGLSFGSLVLGNHVGDWEHTMIRFVGGKPSTIWLSAHSGGFCYTYDAMTKNGSRPIVYSAIGGHANYPTPGTQSRKYGPLILNDTTSMGPVWDPVKSAFFYTYTHDPALQYNGTFTPAMSTGSCPVLSPVDWLYFLGKWGDKQLPLTNPVQRDVIGNYAYEDGPTGPIDKDLQRDETCPNNQPCTTLTVIPVPSGQTSPVSTVVRTFAPTTSCSSTITGNNGSSTIGSAASRLGSSTVTPTSSAGGSAVSSILSSTTATMPAFTGAGLALSYQSWPLGLHVLLAFTLNHWI